MYDQLKINGIRIKIGMKGRAEDGSYPNGGVFTYVAFDRNGISTPEENLIYEKIATYSSAKGKMLYGGSSVN